MKHVSALIMCLFLCYVSKAQDSLLASVLLQKLQDEQVKSDSFYKAGMFPSYRYYGYSPGKAVDDNNIFFTGLIVFTLQGLQPYLHGNDSLLCENIIRQARKSYAYFRNIGERHTYNFWTTHPPLVFPNSWFLNLFKKGNILPDDLDDTVILLMGLEAPDSVAQSVKALMEADANTRTHYIRNTYRKYRHLPAYSTWFGEKMPIDFDFCVLCNVLYFVNSYGLPMNRHDSATITLLEDFIRNKEYITAPAYISPHYARTPVLIYHVARLMGNFPVPALSKYKPVLVAEAKRLLKKDDNIMDRIILGSALIWLGQPAEDIHITADQINSIAGNDFVFFIAGFYSLFPNPFKKMFSNTPLIKYYYRCPAYNEALLLQYLILKNKAVKDTTRKHKVLTFVP